jgi:dTDP-4-dehydrorhamnose reductase
VANEERSYRRPRVLLTGVSGQLGWELRRTLMPLADLVCTTGPDVTEPDTERLDLADPVATRDLVRRAAPDIIVNPAAYTLVDKAEDETDLARKLNALAPGVLAEEAARRGALLVHYSTDYVFDGQAGRPYTEDYPPSPVNVYGQTKLEGEQAIQASGASYLLLRTSWLYGPRGNNFLRTVLRLARSQRDLRIVDDQRGAPTWARQVAEATAQILAQAGACGDDWRKEHTGIYHLTASGSTTWYGFARAILDRARPAGSAVRLAPIATADYPTRATRPPFSVLNCSKAAAHFHLELSPWESQLARVLEEVDSAAEPAG